MADEAVPSGEMPKLSSQRDPVDAVLSGDRLDEDLFDVAALVHDIRAAYLSDEPLRRQPALAAFTEGHLADSGPTVPVADGAPPAPATGPEGLEIAAGNRHRALAAISGVVGTFVGKAALATAVAATGVGALHATEVVNVPGLPDRARSPAIPAEEQPPAGKADDGDGQGEPSGPADPDTEGEATPAQNREAARDYTDAVQEWTDCVAGAAAAQGGNENPSTGGFDPREGCGEKPSPEDFGLRELPSQASDTARDSTGAGEPAEDAPGRGSGANPEQPGSNRPEGKGKPADGTGGPGTGAGSGGGGKPGGQGPPPGSGQGNHQGSGSPMGPGGPPDTSP